jgi:hypothetical protein
MKFQTLKDHLEHYGCTVDHLEDIVYGVSNCINGEYCEIESLSNYGEVALSHYSYELGIPALPGYEDALEHYRGIREGLEKIVTDIEKSADEEGK